MAETQQFKCAALLSKREKDKPTLRLSHLDFGHATGEGH